MSTIGVRSIASAANVDADVVDRENRHLVQAERVRPMLRSRGEHAPNGSIRVPAGMHLPNGSIREVQPSDHDDIVARPKPVECLPDVQVEDEPAVRRTLVALTRRDGRIGYRRLNPPDRSQYKVRCHI